MDKVSWSPGIFVMTKIPGDHDFLTFFSNMTNFKTYCTEKFIINSMGHNNPLKLLEFGTCYIKPDPPLLFHQQNMEWSRKMVHSYFTLCLRGPNYIKQLSQHPWYGLWMRVKGPHHYKVTALGFCVDGPN